MTLTGSFGVLENRMSARGQRMLAISCACVLVIRRCFGGAAFHFLFQLQHVHIFGVFLYLYNYYVIHNMY